jgi:S-DNA-T family DNA segregation ATPase FtsK/SpoIIIE
MRSITLSDKESNAKAGFLSTGALSIGIGLLLKTIALPTFLAPPLYPALLIGAGTACFAMYFRVKDDWTKLFKLLKLQNTEEETPKLMKKTTESDGIHYEFTLPEGLSLNDFTLKKEAIEQARNHKILLNYKDKKVILTEVNETDDWWDWYRLFNSMRLCTESESPQFIHKIERPNSVVFEFTLPMGLSLQHFLNKQEPIEQYRRHLCQIDYDFDTGHIFIVEFGEQPKTIPFKPVDINNPAEILIGYDRDGNVITVDLGDGEPHMYIAGETGCGKSTTMWSIITNMLLFNDVELWLGDLKGGVEFSMFYGHPKVTKLATTVDEVGKIFEEIETEIKARLALFRKNRVRNIKAFNQKVEYMKYKFIIIDELAQLTYGKNKEPVQALERISAMARACGIHLIIGTQRPDKEVINGRIKINFANIIGMKTLNRTNSMVILDHDGCESLQVGQAIFKRGLKEVYVQIPLITDEQAEVLIN